MELDKLSSEMRQIYEEGYREGFEIGYREELLKVKQMCVKTMARNGMTAEQIAEIIQEQADLVRIWLSEEEKRNGAQA